jgi:nuclear GTP-binding protein
VDAADVIIQVLDARDPLACRAPEVERFVRSRGADKRIVLLLNKVDLVPREAAEAWLAYLREELPTVAFKCATSSGGSGGAGRKALPRTGTSGADGAGGGECVGADMLVGLLKNYARSRGLKTAISVGIVGLPNVGKSSLINSLCRSRAAATGATPGLTRAAQEVQLDRHVKLLDSPGIVFATAAQPGGEAAAALRNAIRVERLEDPLPAVGEILARARKETLMELYGIPRFEDANGFLRAVATRRGKLKRGGVPDALAAARMVLTDWNTGKIPFFTMPPRRGDGTHEQAAVVAAFSADFDVAALNSAVISAEAAAGGAAGAAFMQLPGEADAALGAWAPAGDEEDGAQPMEGAPDGESLPPAAALRPAKRAKAADTKAQNEVLYGNDGQQNIKAVKAERKRAKKAGPAAAAPAAGDGGGTGEDDGGEFDWQATTADAQHQAALRKRMERGVEPFPDAEHEEGDAQEGAEMDE